MWRKSDNVVCSAMLRARHEAAKVNVASMSKIAVLVCTLQDGDGWIVALVGVTSIYAACRFLS